MYRAAVLEFLTSVVSIVTKLGCGFKLRLGGGTSLLCLLFKDSMHGNAMKNATASKSSRHFFLTVVLWQHHI
jgi:hypothetical protein